MRLGVQFSGAVSEFKSPPPFPPREHRRHPNSTLGLFCRFYPGPACYVVNKRWVAYMLGD